MNDIQVELKPSYFKQALRNLAAVKFRDDSDQIDFQFAAEVAQ